jgi:hypothetical protein
MQNQRNSGRRAAYLLAAIVIAAAAAAAAVWLHGYSTAHKPPSTKYDRLDAEIFGCSSSKSNPVCKPALKVHPSWADPAAIAIAIVGLGAGGALAWKAARL